MPGAVLPAYTALFMDSLAAFVRNYFPVFMLGALFGKLIEVSGFARSIAAAISRAAGRRHAMLGIVVICALMVYGGVSVFVVAFAVYPFAAELFRAAKIPKRLIPATMSLGTFTFAMDALPGSRRSRTSSRRRSSERRRWRRRSWDRSAAGFSWLGGWCF